MRLSALVVLTALAFTISTAVRSSNAGENAAPAAPADAGLEKVMEVESAHAQIENGEAVRVTARGVVNSGGWTDVQLVPAPDRAAPAQLVFLLMARPPEGMATMALEKVTAETVVPFREAPTSVAVHAQNGMVKTTVKQ